MLRALMDQARLEAIWAGLKKEMEDLDTPRGEDPDFPMVVWCLTTDQEETFFTYYDMALEAIPQSFGEEYISEEGISSFKIEKVLITREEWERMESLD